jgi:hypothetical protein
VRDHGGKFSVGKHYQSPKYGVFTELIFSFEERLASYVRRVHKPIQTPRIGSDAFHTALADKTRNVEWRRNQVVLMERFVKQPWITPLVAKP